jgi:hypothetical protein
MKTKKIILACLVAFSLINLSCKKAEKTAASSGGSGGGTSTPTLSRYITSCTTLGGTVHAANSIRVDLVFTGAIYDLNYFYYIDSGCATPAYTISLRGNFTIGVATTAPVNGFKINFTGTRTIVTNYTAASATSLNSLCGSHWTAGGPTSSYNATVPGLSCGGGAIGVSPSGTVIYNAFVINGSVLSLGAFTINDPGTTVIGSTPTSTSFDITNY